MKDVRGFLVLSKQIMADVHRKHKWNMKLSARTTYVPWEQSADWSTALKHVTQTVADLEDVPYSEEFRRH